MIRWLLIRTAQALATLAAALVILFFLMRLVPGDPVTAFIGDRAMSQADVQRIRDRYCLDCSLPHQFSQFIGRAFRGDLGTSIQHQRPVTQLMAERLPATLLLGGSTLFLNFTLGLALGVWQAVRKGRTVDRLLTAVSLVGYAVPSFWLGLILAWMFAVRLHWFPSSGITSIQLSSEAGPIETALDIGRHLVLPVVTLSVVSIAAMMRYQRNAMIEVLRLDYIRTARAKGLAESTVVIRHAWRNALFPILTLFGLWLPILATGSVFVESVFGWSGLGLLATNAIGGRDYPVLMGSAILVSTLIVLGGLITDIGYMILDPQVRHR
ncbi:MAG: ABC transporter permease [Gemmatimonadota bacterium]